MKLNIDKRNRIINSSLKEFSRHGFERASINNIIKDAKVSKGLLYHYFPSKLDLYEFIKEYSINTFIDYLNKEINWDESDFFIRLKQIAHAKYRIISKYMFMYDFFLDLYKGKSKEEILELLGEETIKLQNKIFTYNIDYSKFREDIDLDISMKMIFRIMDKTSEEYIELLMSNDACLNLEELFNEFDENVNVMRKLFYK